MGQQSRRYQSFAALFCLALLAALLAPLTMRLSQAQTTSADTQVVTLHINPQAVNANDNNNGDESAPLKTIAGAFEKMIPLRQSGAGVRFLLYPGTYRTPLLGKWDSGVQNRVDRLPAGAAPLIFEATEPGKTIISGSDVWTDWQNQSNGLFTREWPHDWGAPKPDWAGPDVTEMTARREMVFVNGERLTQTLDGAKLDDNSFYVDEAANQIRVKVASNVDLNAATVEVAVRKALFFAWDQSNITLRGLVFQHANDAFSEAAVSFTGYGSSNYPSTGCTNITLENNRIVQNNQAGIDVTARSNVTMRGNTVNDNGFLGIGGGYLSTVVMQGNETARNSWRAWAGNYKEWATAGVKFLTVDSLTVRRHVAFDNQSDGFWLDTDVKNTIIEDSFFARNAANGLVLEHNGGPFVVRNNTICKNYKSGVSLWSSSGVQLQNNTIANNARIRDGQPAGPDPFWAGQILLAESRRKSIGQPGLTFPEKRTLETYLENLELTGNTIVGGPNQWLIATYFLDRTISDSGNVDGDRGSSYNRFVTSLKSSNNTWHSPDAQPFTWNYPTESEPLDFAGFASRTA
jgi:parallel beta-helix repeat protein